MYIYYVNIQHSSVRHQRAKWSRRSVDGAALGQVLRSGAHEHEELPISRQRGEPSHAAVTHVVGVEWARIFRRKNASWSGSVPSFFSNGSQPNITNPRASLARNQPHGTPAGVHESQQRVRYASSSSLTACLFATSRVDCLPCRN